MGINRVTYRIAGAAALAASANLVVLATAQAAPDRHYASNGDCGGWPATAVRMACGLGVSLVLAGVAERLEQRRAPWSWARSLPWSSARRVGEDALVLAAWTLPVPLPAAGRGATAHAAERRCAAATSPLTRRFPPSTLRRYISEMSAL